MDDHYRQVMERIGSAPVGEQRWYFGYSSVLDRDAFREWQQEHGYTEYQLPQGELASAQGQALSFNFNSRWWGGLVPGLEPRDGGVVHGLLFCIRSEDWPIIQHKEGVVTGVSVEVPVVVTRADGSTVDAIAFTTNPARASTAGKISARYLDAWQKGARASGLPEDYIKDVMASAV